MPQLEFINEDKLRSLILDLINKYITRTQNFDLKKLNRNKIDPFNILFLKELKGWSWEEIIDFEIQRQLQKSLTNDIGKFHQDIFKLIDHCEVPDHGWDVIYSPEEKIEDKNFGEASRIFVELKNKFNTMNSSASNNVYQRMQNKILDDDDCICVLVEVIAKNSQDIPWKISVNGKAQNHKRIRRMSIDKFYELITGDENAFYKLSQKILEILKSVIKDLNLEIPESNAYKGIKELSELYKTDIKDIILSFGFDNYNGFIKDYIPPMNETDDSI